MIALDTNVLIYAHRAATPEHAAAVRAIEKASAHPQGCGIAVFSIAEFWTIVTHPTATGRPSLPREAAGFLEVLVADANCAVWTPEPGFGDRLAKAAVRYGIAGAKIFDLQIGLLAAENGARRVWTHDKHFFPLPGLRIEDPL